MHSEEIIKEGKEESRHFAPMFLTASDWDEDAISAVMQDNNLT